MKTACALASLVLLAVLLAISLLALDEHVVVLALAGDVMLGRSVAEANAEGGWDDVLAALTPYTASVDLAFANLESPLTTASLIADRYDLRAPPEAVRALRTSGFDLLSLANNHAMDTGVSGLEETQYALRSAAIAAVGPGEEVVSLTINNVSMAWIALDDVMHPIDVERVKERITSLRWAADFLIASIHWGIEFESSPSERQRRLAFELATAGVDLVIGHHSHVLQPVEWIWGAGRGRPTLVVYGLGNAMFDQGTPARARQGATLLLEVGDGGMRIIQAVPHRIEPGIWRVMPAGPSVSNAVAESLNLNCDWVQGCCIAAQP